MKREYFFYLFCFLLLVFLVGFPFYAQWKRTPAGSIYQWVHKIHEDYYGYLSYIRQGRMGAWAHTDQYVTEANVPTRVHIYYLVLGHIGRLTGIPDIGMYYIGWIVPFLTFFVAVILMVRMLLSGFWRYAALAILFFAGPFPRWNIKLGSFTIGLGSQWWSQMDFFSRASYKPHHFMGIACMMVACVFLFRFRKSKRIRDALYAGFANAIGSIVFAVPGIFFLTGLTATLLMTFPWKKAVMLLGHGRVIKETGWVGYGAIILATAAAILWVSGNMAQSNVNLLDWEGSRFNVSTSPVWELLWLFVIQYGILPVFWIPGVYDSIKKHRYEWIFISIMTLLPLFFFVLSSRGWFAIPSIRMVYATPYVFGGLLAVRGLQVWNTQAKKAHPFLIGCLILVFLATATASARDYWLPEVTQAPYGKNIFIPQSYLTALAWLNSNTPASSNVFSTFYTGMFIPAFTDKNVYIGHEAKNDFYTRWWYANEFANGRLDPALAKEEFRKHRIAYVFWDEGQLPLQYGPFLKEVYGNDAVRIYKVEW